MKVAIVHDWLNQKGGAERVLEALKEEFPDAPVFTSIYWPEAMPPAYRRWTLVPSFLDRWPGVHRHHQWFLPLYPLAFESFDFSDYDVVISNKSGFCHGIITPPETLHICYCLAPTRYVWDYRRYAQRERLGRAASVALTPLLSYLRLWDRLAADRVDQFVAISREIQGRIRNFYRRPSTIIYPPVNTDQILPGDGYDEYYLIVSRLVPYKRIDLAVQAFSELRLPLKVVGDGRDRRRLESLAGPTVQFLGEVDDAQTRQLFQRCAALIFPGVEDFGIVPLEAQSAGRPVIAFAAGGALDTVVEGVTGTFFHEPTSEALKQAVQTFDPAAYDGERIRRHALAFSRERFRREMRAYVEERLAEFRAGAQP
ncbi:MAG: glycosyltransferase family 4 protein [Chloroflexi bacterium]|nr:glycosyltransferase family 4 protein [Chloroflexota bacterium]